VKLLTLHLELADDGGGAGEGGGGEERGREQLAPLHRIVVGGGAGHVPGAAQGALAGGDGRLQGGKAGRGRKAHVLVKVVEVAGFESGEEGKEEGQGPRHCSSWINERSDNGNGGSERKDKYSNKPLSDLRVVRG
jgi:hypothetical protein